MAADPVAKPSPKPANPSRPLPWFRLYSEFVTDPTITILPFADQRHFIALLCLKCNGLLDRQGLTDERREALIAHAMGLNAVDAVAVRVRLTEAGLVDGNWQPNGWESRQFQSDRSIERVQKYRAKVASNLEKRRRNGRVTVQDSETETETETEKNLLLPVATTRRGPK